MEELAAGAVERFGSCCILLSLHLIAAALAVQLESCRIVDGCMHIQMLHAHTARMLVCSRQQRRSHTLRRPGVRLETQCCQPGGQVSMGSGLTKRRAGRATETLEM